MLLNLTEEQILQLAPDASSVKAAKGLALPGKRKKSISDCNRFKQHSVQMFLPEPKISM